MTDFQYIPGIAGCSYIRSFEDMYGGDYTVAPTTMFNRDGAFITIGVPDLDRIRNRSTLMQNLEDEGEPSRGVICLSIEEAENLRVCLDECIKRAKAKEPSIGRALAGDPEAMLAVKEWLA